MSQDERNKIMDMRAAHKKRKLAALEKDNEEDDDVNENAEAQMSRKKGKK